MNYTITEAQRIEAMDALYLPSMKTEAMLRQKDKAYVMLQALTPVGVCNEVGLYKAALREHIRLYQVDDQDCDPESRTDKIMNMAIERMREKK